MDLNGKRIDKQGHPVDFDTGPIIWGEPGTNGQHSFYQSIIRGRRLFPFEFFGFKRVQYRQDVLLRSRRARKSSFEPLCPIDCVKRRSTERQSEPGISGEPPQSDPAWRAARSLCMGAILAYYEHKVAFQGFMWNINSFDQEGVQLGKKLALKIVDQFAAKREGKSLDPKNFPLGQAYLRHLN